MKYLKNYLLYLIESTYILLYMDSNFLLKTIKYFISLLEFVHIFPIDLSALD